MTRRSPWLCLLSLVVMNAGCAVAPPGISDPYPITVERVPSNDVSLGRVKVLPTEDGLSVSGNVSFDSSRRERITGHLDIMLRDSSGRAVAHHAVNYQTQWRPHRPRSGRLAWAHPQPRQLARFSARIDHPPQPGLVIQLSHHQSDAAACPRRSLVSGSTLDPQLWPREAAATCGHLSRRGAFSRSSLAAPRQETCQMAW